MVYQKLFSTILKLQRKPEKKVQAIANMLLQYDKKVEEVRMDMRIKNETGKVVIKDNVFEAIYRKFVKDMEQAYETEETYYRKFPQLLWKERVCLWR